MDLLKEEKKLIEKLVKARQEVDRKLQYLTKSQGSFTSAQREVKAAETRVRKIRKQIRAQGVEDLTVPEPLDYPKVPAVPEAIVETEPVEENTD